MKQKELLAGVLRILILNELSRAPGYGYGIAKNIKRRSEGEVTVRPESLYPVLHRMEQDGLLTARWEQAENGRPRKVYTLTGKGRRRWEHSRASFVSFSRGALKAVETPLAEDPA